MEKDAFGSPRAEEHRYQPNLASRPPYRDTSRTCSECGHCKKDNRKSQAKFLCVSCGMSRNADQNAALNIRAQATRKMASELASLRA
jgi:transposase